MFAIREVITRAWQEAGGAAPEFHQELTGHSQTDFPALPRRYPADPDFPPDNGAMLAEEIFTSRPGRRPPE